MDVTPKCVEACRQRFADRSGARFEVNDGHSLPMVEDSSIDFAFSFDSLVHVEAETLAGYLGELARVLKPDGVAFLHHSNYRHLRTFDACARTIARLVRPTPSFGPGRPLTLGDLPGHALAGPERHRCPLCRPLRQVPACTAWGKNSSTGRAGSSSSIAFRWSPVRVHVGIAQTES